MEAVTRTRRDLLDLLFDKTLSRTYWPTAPRKSKARVFSELIWWLVRTGDANRFHYAYGPELKVRRRCDVMPFSASWPDLPGSRERLDAIARRQGAR